VNAIQNTTDPPMGGMEKEKGIGFVVWRKRSLMCKGPGTALEREGREKPQAREVRSEYRTDPCCQNSRKGNRKRNSKNYKGP